VKVIMPVALPDVMELCKRHREDRWDEMWDGVLHMPPLPNLEQQELEGSLETYLRQRWAPGRKAKVYHQVVVAPANGWPNNYRVPDLVLLLPEGLAIDRQQYLEGGPDAVIEIQSPGDESYEKLPFYAAVGVSEVWIIQRDTKEPEIHLLKRGRYKELTVQTDGWLRSPATGLEMRVGRPGKLAVRLEGDEASRQELPPD
jgi:Uma2 family endonuclease